MTIPINISTIKISDRCVITSRRGTDVSLLIDHQRVHASADESLDSSTFSSKRPLLDCLFNPDSDSKQDMLFTNVRKSQQSKRYILTSFAAPAYSFHLFHRPPYQTLPNRRFRIPWLSEQVEGDLFRSVWISTSVYLRYSRAS